jgi:hypothetical protein
VRAIETSEQTKGQRAQVWYVLLRKRRENPRIRKTKMKYEKGENGEIQLA